MNILTSKSRPSAWLRPISLWAVALFLFPASVVAVAAEADAAPAEPEKVGWIEPVAKQVEGWTVQVDPALLAGAHREEGDLALKMLANHLQRIAILVPERQLRDLRKVGIWLEHSHPELKAMQYHPGKDWLVDRGYDPRLTKKVHITRAAELFSREQMLKHPAVILHELAHAYHDQVLGFDNPGVLKVYQAAMKKGIYDQVLLFNGRQVRHYATTDHKEYFAEATEAYFYRNDFYPFVRAELEQHDPAGCAEMKKIWGDAGKNAERAEAGGSGPGADGSLAMSDNNSDN